VQAHSQGGNSTATICCDFSERVQPAALVVYAKALAELDSEIGRVKSPRRMADDNRVDGERRKQQLAELRQRDVPHFGTQQTTAGRSPTRIIGITVVEDRYFPVVFALRYYDLVRPCSPRSDHQRKHDHAEPEHMNKFQTSHNSYPSLSLDSSSECSTQGWSTQFQVLDPNTVRKWGGG